MTHYGQQRLVLRIVRRVCDAVGLMLLYGREYELEGWWTTLDQAHYSDDDIIALYMAHATSEQFHSEFKTDLYLERLPSGKFATNALIMRLAALTYLQHSGCMGQKPLLNPAGLSRTPCIQTPLFKNSDAGTDLSGCPPDQIRTSVCPVFWKEQPWLPGLWSFVVRICVVLMVLL